MPKRAIYSDKVFKGSLPFAQATIAGGFMFVCCVGRDREGKFAVGDVRSGSVKRCAAAGSLVTMASVCDELHFSICRTAPSTPSTTAEPPKSQ